MSVHEPNELVERIERSTSAIGAASGAQDVFRGLLDGAAACAPRVAVFVVRGGTVRGWGVEGYPSEAAVRLRGATVPPGRGWPGRLAADGAPDRAYRRADETGPDDLGPEDASRGESLAFAVRVGARTLAIVLAERDPGESPWSPAGIGVLTTFAGMRLEVDLARRRLDRATGSHAAPSPPPEPDAEAAPPAQTDDPTPGATEAAGLAPTGDESVEPRPPSPADEAARRFARLVATDIRLYNEEEVVLGRRDGDLDSRLHRQIGQGRETFERRFPDLGDRGTEILHEAMVQVLAGGDASLLPPDSLRRSADPGRRP